MVINPQQALELTREDKSEVDCLEKRLDEWIKLRFTRGIQEVFFTVPQGTSQKVLDKLMARCRAASWNVRYECDQRDGNYLKLSPIKKSVETRSVDYRDTSRDYPEGWRNRVEGFLPW